MECNATNKRSSKSSKTRRETAVQGTNDNSIVSKCSMAASGYFEDNFLKYFVAKSSRRAPLIHRGYYIRAKTVNYIVTEFLHRHGSAYKQIVSLGCGFDSAYFRLKSSGKMENIVYVEIDFPEVVRRKNVIIKNTPELHQLLGEEQVLPATSPHIEMNRTDYKMLGVDLTQLNTLEAALRLCGVDFDAPTLLLSECVLTYMTRRCSSAVVRWAAETFSDSVFVLYEQINPNDPFGLFMQNHYNTIGSPLKSINPFPTLQSQNDRFVSLGWSWCEAYDMNQFYTHLVNQEEKRFINNLEPFDEYEEWHLKCSHYFVLCAYSQTCKGLLEKEEIKNDETRTASQDAIPNLIEVLPSKLTSNIKRFSHTSTRLDKNLVATVGGFGEQDGRHQRISEVRLVDIATNERVSLRPNDETVELARMHHSVDVLNDGRLVLFGGRISPFRLCSQLIMLTFIKHNSANCDSQPNDCDSASNSEGTNSLKAQNCDLTDSNSLNSASNCENISPKPEEVNPEGSKSDLRYTLEHNIVEQSGDVPCLRWRHATTKVTLEGKEYIYLYGGRNSSEAALCDSYLLDPTTAQWRQLDCQGTSPRCRQSHTVSPWREGVVVWGGLDDLLLPQNTAHYLDLGSRMWSQLPIQGSLQPRYSHTAHVSDDTLIVIGGVNLYHGTPGAAMLDLVSGRCEEYQLPEAVKENLKMFHKHSSLVLDNGQFLIIGGGGNCFSFGSHLNSSPFILDLGLCIQHFNNHCV